MKDERIIAPIESGFFDLPKGWTSCPSPEHYPPQHLSIPHGQGYKHVCPACGKAQIIIPPQVTL